MCDFGRSNPWFARGDHLRMGIVSARFQVEMMPIHTRHPLPASPSRSPKGRAVKSLYIPSQPTSSSKMQITTPILALSSHLNGRREPTPYSVYVNASAGVAQEQGQHRTLLFVQASPSAVLSRVSFLRRGGFSGHFPLSTVKSQDVYTRSHYPPLGMTLKSEHIIHS